MENFIKTSKQTILDNEQETVTLDKECAEIRRVMDTESGGELKALEDELNAKTKQESKVQGEKNSIASNLDAENRKLKRTEKAIKDDENTLKAKEAAMEKLKNLFESLKSADEIDSNAYEESKKKYEAISSGLATNESGEASSLQDQLLGKQKSNLFINNFKLKAMLRHFEIIFDNRNHFLTFLCHLRKHFLQIENHRHHHRHHSFIKSHARRTLYKYCTCVQQLFLFSSYILFYFILFY